MVGQIFAASMRAVGLALGEGRPSCSRTAKPTSGQHRLNMQLVGEMQLIGRRLALCRPTGGRVGLRCRWWCNFLKDYRVRLP